MLNGIADSTPPSPVTSAIGFCPHTNHYHNKSFKIVILYYQLASTGITRGKDLRSEFGRGGAGNSYVERASRVQVYIKIKRFYFLTELL